MKIIRTAALVAVATAAVSKAKEYARDHPSQASERIDTVESFVRGKAGPKYSDKVGQGSAALKKSLGLPTSTPGSAPSAGSDARPVSSPAAGEAPGAGFDPSI